MVTQGRATRAASASKAPVSAPSFQEVPGDGEAENAIQEPGPDPPNDVAEEVVS
jgi:hypothetical protein